VSCHRPGKVSRKRLFRSAFSPLRGEECLRLEARVTETPIRRYHAYDRASMTPHRCSMPNAAGGESVCRVKRGAGLASQ
jgi:hypothetical protein